MISYAVEPLNSPYESTLAGKEERMKSDYISSQIKKGSNPPSEYKQVTIPNAYSNRKPISTHGKGVPGVYVFKDYNTGAMYVGGAVNLYNRATTYFMPSILSTLERRVYRYFDKYGFNSTDLTLFMMPKGTSVTEITKLEQHFIDLLKPDLNVDLVAGGSNGYHSSMSEEMKHKLRLERGTVLYIYDTTLNGFIHMFYSKQSTYNGLNIHHKSLSAYLDTGNAFMGRFVFSTMELDKYPMDIALSLEDMNTLFKEVREAHQKSKHPNTKGIYAENIKDSKLSGTFVSITAFADKVKGDRASIRTYLNGDKPAGSLYRGT